MKYCRWSIEPVRDTGLAREHIRLDMAQDTFAWTSSQNTFTERQHGKPRKRTCNTQIFPTQSARKLSPALSMTIPQENPALKKTRQIPPQRHLPRKATSKSPSLKDNFIDHASSNESTERQRICVLPITYPSFQKDREYTCVVRKTHPPPDSCCQTVDTDEGTIYSASLLLGLCNKLKKDASPSEEIRNLAKDADHARWRWSMNEPWLMKAAERKKEGLEAVR